MRTLLGPYSVLLFAVAVACQNAGEGRMQSDQDQPQRFATQDEAVRKAKADFLEALRSGADLNLGVDAATLEGAEPGPSIRRVDLDFDRLLEADSAASFPGLIASERNLVVPFMAAADVVTIAEVVQEEAGWRVVGLAGADIANDLSVVMRAAADTSYREITLYEVPNLQVRVYGVTRDDAEVLFADYGDRFSLRQGVDAATLLPVLRRDAVEFQRVYGDSLPGQRLLR